MRISPKVLLLIATATLTLLSLPSIAQSPAPQNGAIPALFLSDIHLDPYHDPAKVARLNAAPASQWPVILSAPDSPTLAADDARLQETCPTRGTDTPDTLWRSSLRAIRAQTAAGRPAFVTISGDLLAHSFDCKYRALLPAATHAQYVAFTEKTLRYVLSGLRTTLPQTPIYLALGNNDSGCTDYHLAASHDELLSLTAGIAAELLPPAILDQSDRAKLLATFPDTGSYSAPLAGVPNTRILVLDDVFLSPRYATCGGTPDTKPAAAQLDWLAAQLSAAREHNQRVWVLGHIPTGIDLYSTARKLTDVCSGGKPVTFLASNQLGQALAASAGTIRLALFGHTHSDEMQLLQSDASVQPDVTNDTAADAPAAASGTNTGVPVKIIASITPVNGNRPTFTLATVDTQTADLKDFTVYQASNATGIGTTWTREYTYSDAYHQTAFDSPALHALITGFQADRPARTPISQAYLRNYFPGDLSGLLQFVWPEYACGMDHTSPRSFAACICAAKPKP
ncbi:MAG: hypothetical protein NVSMB62_20100 [Acidobacteriaceae bacterium]